MTNVLVIGMLDSVHLSRWLSQFEDQPITFTIFPSKKFRSVHPDLIRLVNSNKNFFLAQKKLIKLYGYKEFILNKFLARASRRFSSEYRLARLINRYNFDYIHAIEIQGAGYLLLDSCFKKTIESQSIILTNWGSDIYYYEKYPEDKIRIQGVLSIADYYSAECHRDYELALKNGFLGKFLPVNPNAGGFREDVIQRNIKTSNDRDLIVAKCYGGEFGLGSMVIDAIDSYLSQHDELSVFFYSVTADLESKVTQIKGKYGNRVNYSTTKIMLSLDEIYNLFANAKIYIGASRSDGISTSFLEALVLGAYPIQTSTSCCLEWINKGFKASATEPSVRDLLNTLNYVTDSVDFESARKTNLKLSRTLLSYEAIKKESLTFYSS